MLAFKLTAENLGEPAKVSYRPGIPNPDRSIASRPTVRKLSRPHA
jgi:hypothetical protein